MNRQRRKKLDEVVEMLTNAQSELENIRDEEQECFDCLTEGLQQTERGQRMEEVAGEIDDIICNIDEVISSIDSLYY